MVFFKKSRRVWGVKWCFIMRMANGKLASKEALFYKIVNAASQV